MINCSKTYNTPIGGCKPFYTYVRLYIMRYLIFFAIAVIPWLAYGQQPPNPIGNFNTPAAWQKARQIKQMPAISLTAKDTALVVISNRIPANDTLRYMSEHRDEKALHYFFVFTRNGDWNVLPTQTLEEAIKYMPDKNKDWVLYTEGMGKLFTSDLQRAIAVAGQYDVNVMLFDYPSITTTKKSLGNYFFAIGNARHAYLDFAPAFAHVKQLREDKKMGNGKLSMFFHSMGNHVMRQTVKHGKLEAINNTVWVDNLIFNAPCVPRRGHKRWINRIDFAKHIYINYNNNDFTLGGAYLVSKKIQLGQKPVRNISKKATYINFNTLVDKGHSNFLSIPGREPIKPAALHYYNIVLHGDAINEKDTKHYSVSQFKNIGLDLLP